MKSLLLLRVIIVSLRPLRLGLVVCNILSCSLLPLTRQFSWSGRLSASLAYAVLVPLLYIVDLLLILLVTDYIFIAKLELSENN